MYFCVVLCIVCFVTFPVLFVCICVLNNCHRVATQLQLTNISYHINPQIYLHHQTNLAIIPTGISSVNSVTRPKHSRGSLPDRGRCLSILK